MGNKESQPPKKGTDPMPGSVPAGGNVPKEQLDTLRRTADATEKNEQAGAGTLRRVIGKIDKEQQGRQN